MAFSSRLFNTIGKVGLGVAVAGGVINSMLYNVDGGHRAVIFDRFQGVKPDVIGEGTHFMIPWSCTNISSIYNRNKRFANS